MMYSNCCCFKSEIIKIGQSCQKMYSNNILNFQESTRIVNAFTKKVWKLIEGISYVYICVRVCVCVVIEVYVYMNVCMHL